MAQDGSHCIHWGGVEATAWNRSQRIHGDVLLLLFSLFILYTCFLSSHSMPRPCGRNRGEAYPAQRELPVKLLEPWFFTTVLCVSEAHLTPLFSDGLEGKDGFLFWFERAVSGTNQSLINLLS